MRRLAVFSVLAGALAACSGNAFAASVTAVRHWSVGSATRVAVEVAGDFHYRSDRLHNPERIYFDIVNARNALGVRYHTEDVGDSLVRRIRVAETNPGTTRVVIELGGDVRVTTTQLANPSRLMIELRSSSAPATPTRLSIPEPEVRKPEVSRPPVVIRAFQPPPRAVRPETERPLAPLPSPPILVARAPTPLPALVATTAAAPAPPPDQPGTPPPPLVKPAAPLPEIAQEVGKAARRTANGETSLTRALGLKLNRVVIDAGHGGHDQGTASTKGLLEKDLVLDVALRVGKLIEDRLRAEVIYTRSTDVFVPLESRTALANDKKADLFLSIHANASSAPSASGVETYFLNFTESKDAMAVAARENASSQATISELHDLIRQITLHDKAEESRDLAGNIQTSLFGLYVRNFPGEHDRGVRRAPFVVLIGATMPSVLAEIGFLTNPKEESLLRKPEYRQKVAEAVERGVERYANGLSHFQVAQIK